MATSSTPKYPTTPYTPRPNITYTPSDFDRQDPSPDSTFYSTPRFVTHIDDAAISTLTNYYTTQIFHPLFSSSSPSQQTQSSGESHKLRVLDFCTSHLTHYPPSFLQNKKTVDGEGEGEVEVEVEVIGLGMNRSELDGNPLLTKRVLADLNREPDIAEHLGFKEGNTGIDVATCVVSIDYLVHPVEVLRSLRGVVKVGGAVHLVVSNRCFPTKAVRRWLVVDEEERLRMVGDFLWRAGWRRVEIVTLSDGRVAEGEGEGEGWLGRLMGMRGRDPLWVVRGWNLKE